MRARPDILFLLLVLRVSASAVAQPDLTEAFFEEHGLSRYTESYLIEQAEHSTGETRDRFIARLGSYYATRLAGTESDAERERLLTASQRLLETHRDLELTGLRLAVAIARYRPAEEIAERARLLLADEAERERAVELLEQSLVTFTGVGEQLERDVLYQERRQRAESARDPGAVVPELAEAVRDRSLAKFYAGWAVVYTAGLTGRSAEEALDHFAWVLDTPGESPSLDRLPRSLLRYDHVARAAIGVATAHSLMGDHRVAMEWFDAVQEAASASEPIQAQLRSRTIEAMARAGQWESLRQLAHDPAQIGSLGSANARLLTVLALERRRDPTTSSSLRLTLEDVARAALKQLVELGELSHVVNIAARFQNLPLEGDGFAVAYVLGSDLFAQAREAHRQSGSEPGSPAASIAVQGAYRNAAQRLQAAVRSQDAPAYPRERARAAFDAAACWYYAEGLREAAGAFLQAESLAVDDEQRERALWMAFVVSDTLAERGEPTEPDRSALARRYLAEHPSGQRAATMLLRTLGAELVTDARAIEILRSVPPGDPIAVLARRELARLLYRRVRSLQGIARSETAAEFLALARELMTMPPSHPNAPAPDVRSQLARQVLDVALLVDPPLIDVAKRTLALVDDLPQGDRAATHADEFRLRRMQLALAENREADARALAASFDDPAGRFAVAAAKLLWNRTLSEWRRGRTVPKARALVSDGRFFTSDNRFEPANADQVAEAAAYMWEQSEDAASRDLALRIDRRLFEEQRASERSLRRFAALAEAASRNAEARDVWLTILASKDDGTPGWFEARYESLRLLAAESPSRARVAFDQLAALYPSLGSEPWSSKLRALERTLPAPDAP
ncbi:MAG: hypothetical protein RIB60_08790 [Phycisphaerales bacterium]